jgi:hypothetical protein
MTPPSTRCPRSGSAGSQFVEAFEAEDSAGRLRAGVSPEVAANLLVVLAQGLLVMTTTDDDEATLRPVITAALNQLT